MGTRYQRQTELRKLPAGSLTNIASILQVNDDYEKVLRLIPKIPGQTHPWVPKYSKEQIDDMKRHAEKTQRKFAEVLFDEWGTSGRVRPTVDTLMRILQQAQIIRAADELAKLIGEPPAPRPDHGPGAPISISLTNMLKENSGDLSANSQHNSSLAARCNLTTKRMGGTDERVFSESDVPNISAFNSVHTQDSNVEQKQIQEAKSNTEQNSDMMQFSEDLLPAFSVLQKSSITDCIKDSAPVDGNNLTTSNQSSHFSSVLASKSRDIYNIIDLTILDDKKLVPFKYTELAELTNSFSDIFIENAIVGPVGKIGCGGFGDVYVGVHKRYGALAVKRVRFLNQMNREEDIMKTFNTEVKSLSQLRHENIVPIFGYSIDGPLPCIVCQYIDGGSLMQKIANKVLSEKDRIKIMKGTAEGLRYIHHSERPPQTGEVLSETQTSSKKSFYLHGDVKSANILLTRDYIPKLCDFGLAKQLTTTLITRSMMGTTAYMAPEGFSGTITQKNDIFSFGIVLLELITGLEPIITENGETINIKNYVEERFCEDPDISKLFDPFVRNWTVANKVYDLSQLCLKEKRDRPTIDYVCEILNELN